MLVLRSVRSSALRPTCLRMLASQARYQSSSSSSSSSSKPQVSREVTGAGGSPKPSQPLPALTPDASSPRDMQQSPNYPTTWSTSQNPRGHAMSGPRFEQVDLELQATPFSAMAKVAEDPVRLVEGRRAACDGGGGPLGHPKIYINLDKPGPKACGYCGIRFEQAHHAH